MKYFFTADEHYYHSNIIKYCNRPFKSVEEMNDELIKRHNTIVSKDDIVMHLGDFTMKSREMAGKIINRLNGTHSFLKGSHDKWNKDLPHIWEGTVEGLYIVGCHYAMRVWARSHWGSIQLFGHSHGKIQGLENQMDVGVDCNNYYPYSLSEIRRILKK